MSAPTTNSIYLGFWIDWTRGRMYGTTITLSQAYGSFLLRYVFPVLITVALQRLWSIAASQSKILFKNRVSDEVMLEEQAEPEKIEPPVMGWRRFMHASYWRERINCRPVKYLYWAVLGVSLLAIQPVRQTLGEYTTSKCSQNRLVASKNCGYTVPDQQKLANDSEAAADYVRRCYHATSACAASSPQCQRYVRTKLEWSGIANTTCPFRDGICTPGNQGAVTMSTGFIDSLEDLGIVSHPSERLYLRKKVVCSPIRNTREPHLLETNTRGSNLVHHGYGRIQSLDYSDIHDDLATSPSAGYALATTYSIAGRSSPWSPIHALNRSNADVSIMFIGSNGITYAYPNNDPIFGTSTSSGSCWEAAHDVSTLACAEQYQVCVPASTATKDNRIEDHCTPWLGSHQLLSEAVQLKTSSPPSLGLHDEASLTSIFMRMVWPLALTSIHNAVVTRNATALYISKTLFDMTQVVRLSDNHWTREVGWWFEATLARLQQSIVDSAIDPSTYGATTDSNSAMREIGEKGTESLCNMQMIGKGYGTSINFSLLGLILVLGGSSVMNYLLFKGMISDLRAITPAADTIAEEAPEGPPKELHEKKM